MRIPDAARRITQRSTTYLNLQETIASRLAGHETWLFFHDYDSLAMIFISHQFFFSFSLSHALQCGRKPEQARRFGGKTKPHKYTTTFFKDMTFWDQGSP